jgi:hypothetical protein
VRSAGGQPLTRSALLAIAELDCRPEVAFWEIGWQSPVAGPRNRPSLVRVGDDTDEADISQMATGASARKAIDNDRTFYQGYIAQERHRPIAGRSGPKVFRSNRARYRERCGAAGIIRFPILRPECRQTAGPSPRARAVASNADRFSKLFQECSR